MNVHIVHTLFFYSNVYQLHGLNSSILPLRKGTENITKEARGQGEVAFKSSTRTWW